MASNGREEHQEQQIFEKVLAYVSKDVIGYLGKKTLREIPQHLGLHVKWKEPYYRGSLDNILAIKNHLREQCKDGMDHQDDEDEDEAISDLDDEHDNIEISAPNKQTTAQEGQLKTTDQERLEGQTQQKSPAQQKTIGLNRQYSNEVKSQYRPETEVTGHNHDTSSDSNEGRLQGEQQINPIPVENHVKHNSNAYDPLESQTKMWPGAARHVSPNDSEQCTGKRYGGQSVPRSNSHDETLDLHGRNVEAMDTGESVSENQSPKELVSPQHDTKSENQPFTHHTSACGQRGDRSTDDQGQGTTTARDLNLHDNQGLVEQQQDAQGSQRTAGGQQYQAQGMVEQHHQSPGTQGEVKKHHQTPGMQGAVGQPSEIDGTCGIFGQQHQTRGSQDINGKHHQTHKSQGIDTRNNQTQENNVQNPLDTHNESGQRSKAKTPLSPTLYPSLGQVSNPGHDVRSDLPKSLVTQAANPGTAKKSTTKDVERDHIDLMVGSNQWRFICECCPSKLDIPGVTLDTACLINGRIIIKGRHDVISMAWIDLAELVKKVKINITFEEIDISSIISRKDEIIKIADKHRDKDTFKKAVVWVEFEQNIVIVGANKDKLKHILTEIKTELNGLANPKPKRVRKIANADIMPDKTFKTSLGTNIHCVVGDLTTLEIDAVVSSNNGNLSNKVGVSKAIALAAGYKFEDECRKMTKHSSIKLLHTAVTKAHNLPCKHVVHIVSPQRDPNAHDDNKFKENLREAYLRILHKAHQMKLKSIAIPAIGAGQSGMLPDTVAELMCQAVLSFTRTSSTLLDILLIDRNPKIPGLVSSVLAVSAPTNNLLELSRPSCDRFFPGRKRHDCAAAVKDSGANVSRSSERKSHTNDHKSPNASSGTAVNGARSKDITDPNQFDPGKVGARSADTSEKADCSICIETITPDQVSTLPCKHVFCRPCIQTWFKDKPSCPICGEVFGHMKGLQPKGTMRYTEISTTLSGHYADSAGTYMITYDFPSGVQSKDHVNPGRFYKGRQVTAYLPISKDGKEVLRLFERAFHAKLLFTIGTSLTTGRDDRITWNDIHQKTQITGDYGYPDKGYLTRVKGELAAKGIKTELESA